MDALTCLPGSSTIITGTDTDDEKASASILPAISGDKPETLKQQLQKQAGVWERILIQLFKTSIVGEKTLTSAPWKIGYSVPQNTTSNTGTRKLLHPLREKKWLSGKQPDTDVALESLRKFRQHSPVYSSLPTRTQSFYLNVSSIFGSLNNQQTNKTNAGIMRKHNVPHPVFKKNKILVPPSLLLEKNNLEMVKTCCTYNVLSLVGTVAPKKWWELWMERKRFNHTFRNKTRSSSVDVDHRVPTDHCWPISGLKQSTSSSLSQDTSRGMSNSTPVESFKPAKLQSTSNYRKLDHLKPLSSQWNAPEETKESVEEMNSSFPNRSSRSYLLHASESALRRRDCTKSSPFLSWSSSHQEPTADVSYLPRAPTQHEASQQL